MGERIHEVLCIKVIGILLIYIKNIKGELKCSER